MKTRTEVIDYLVAEGKPLNYAKVAVDQGYNYEADGATSDLCRRMPESDETVVQGTYCTSTDSNAVIVTPEDAIRMYNTFEEMLSIENNQILLDGDPVYDLNGDWIK